ncbi:head GIN domain-containing protein [Namhaeicola litoreus]|uniref:Head GIN domain-containing protein n=1 Tax=Namhaeicola litoreus TaxID=1052145 RepID=A0ABW3Y2T5_9FLAO
MNRINKFLTCIMLFGVSVAFAQIKTITVQPFSKVIVSPHIEVVFQEGNKEEVVVQSLSVSEEKFNIESSGKTMHLYLEGAKTITKNEKVENEEWEGKKPIYQGTVATVVVTYKNLEELSLRGEEEFVCKDQLKGTKFVLSLYGETEIMLNDVKLEEMKSVLYGENELTFKSGSIEDHRIISYGESEIDAMEVESETAKITSYGEAEFRLFVNKEIKLTAYGESNLEYKGQPLIKKGIVIGETRVRQINN